MSDGSYGLGDAYSDTLGAISSIFTSKNEAKTTANLNKNLESQLSQTQKTNRYLMYGAFGILAVGALAVIMNTWS